MRLIERRLTASEIAEDEGRSCVGRLLQRTDTFVQKQENAGGRWKLDEQQRQSDLQRHTGNHDTDGNLPAVLAKNPRNEKQAEKPEAPVQHTHPMSSPKSRWPHAPRHRRPSATVCSR